MKTILIVEDEWAIADVMTAALEDEGYRITRAGDGREGLARLAEGRPDLVICDVMMPRLDGRAFSQAMQADPHYRAIPLVLMSAVPESTLHAKAAFNAFLAKPFNLEDLIALVARLIGPAGAEE